MNPAQKQTAKIAVPLFKDRVAPHFGVSSTFLLMETHGTTICREATWNIQGKGPMGIARRLTDLGVETLICGGIPSRYKDWFIGKGITVLDNQKGSAREIVETLFQKKRTVARMTVQPFNEEETEVGRKDTSEKVTEIAITYCVE
ncbi:MAG: NifB/NifX family molybdenum-iron cluster-binding protein [Deltaproteobacteria bacterium]|nr:NifB/NifX family molybdenum-iron cluster-binding protein [Deltaproteobacteria bacterium]